jgi:GNAT superfamily N-acetyltransferase
MDVRALSIDDVTVVAAIDRSERVDFDYHVVDGVLTQRSPVMADIPGWTTTDTGPHSVAHHVEFARRCIEAGGELFAAFEGDDLAGVAIVEPRFDGALARLSFLHVTRAHRRRGVATALWNTAVGTSKAASATAMCVSAAPTQSAVGFYLAQGCVLADPPHPALVAEEPEDIQLVLHFGA